MTMRRACLLAALMGGAVPARAQTVPAAADVAVLGLPDDQWGERVAAVIVPGDARPSADDLAAFARSRLRSTKTPEVWAFRAALPYNDTGKLLRRQLRAELAKPLAPA